MQQWHEQKRDPKRIPKIIKRLRKVWEKCPDLRLGQLIENAYNRQIGEGYKGKDIYYVEDEQLIKDIEKTYLPQVENFAKGNYKKNENKSS